MHIIQCLFVGMFYDIAQYTEGVDGVLALLCLDWQCRPTVVSFTYSEMHAPLLEPIGVCSVHGGG